jgi:hypothetical protein
MASADSGWRVVVQIGSGQPELKAALADMPARARAERLRQLALVGLYSLRVGPAAAGRGPEPVSGRDTVMAERRERLLSGLLQEAD